MDITVVNNTDKKTLINSATEASSIFQRIKRLPSTMVRWYRAHLALSIAIIIGLVSLVIYNNQQAFWNLWLTRDQQGMVVLNQGNPAKAARTFIDKDWIAYSFYADGDYQRAASIYAQYEGTQAKFSQANALAHAGQYFTAAELYQSVIEQEPNNQQAIENLALMEKIISNLKKSPGKKTLSTEIADGQKFVKVEKKPKSNNRLPSHALWLEQVQQNPSKFLRKKFQQEHLNEQKNAQK